MIEAPSFAVFCAEILGEPITPAWIDFYNVVEGLPVENEALVNQCTGRSVYVPQIHVEATAIVGRRGEKSSSAIKFLLWRALFAGYESQVRRSWFKKLGRHTERLRVVLIAQDMRVAGDAKRTAEALCLGSTVLAREVAEILANELVFKNGVSLICLPASKASVRGMTVPCALIDEMAWIALDGCDSKELLRQLRPAMIQFGQTRRLLKMSTPWQRSGILYEEFSSRASRPDLMVWQASTQQMTDRISAEELEKERLADPVYFEREYMARFVSDLDTFLPWADIEAAIAPWIENPPSLGPSYVGACDASNVTGGDFFTFGIGHGEAGEEFTVDVLRSWKKKPVPVVCDEIASVCQAYGVGKIVADQYSFPFLAELMRVRGIGMDEAVFSAKSKPELHFALKNLLAQGKLRLPNVPEAIRQLRALESTRTSGGGYKIGAPRGANDDFVSVLALLVSKSKRACKLWIPEIIELRTRPSHVPFHESRAGPGLTDPFVEVPGEGWTKIN